MTKYNFQRQLDSLDCGPSCLKMVSQYYGKIYSLEYLRDLCFLNREGVSLPNIAYAASNIGFRTEMAKISFDLLVDECPMPCILHWDQNHFVVLYDIKKKKG